MLTASALGLVATVLTFGACAPQVHYASGSESALGLTVDSLRRHGLHLSQCVKGGVAAPGAPGGCLGTLHDTSVFFLIDGTGRVVVVRRDWDTTDESARRAAATLGDSLTRRFGAPQDCPTRGDGVVRWQLERLWRTPAGQVALWAGTPRDTVSEKSRVVLEERVEARRCGLWHGFPFRID